MHQLYYACMYQTHSSIFTPIPSLSLSIKDKDTYKRVIANMELVKCEANTAPLTPLTFLNRAATAYASRTSIIYKTTRFTWHQTYQRCCRLASSLNITKNDVVSVLAPNVPAVYEMHFAVPMAGAILNTRLDANNIATILRHAEPKLFFVDHQLTRLARDALNCLAKDPIKPPLVVVIDELDAPTGARLGLGELEYEQLVRNGDPAYEPHVVEDEWDSIALNYTSGTTSAPKGVVYSHRVAYLSSGK